jgi:protein TonB
MSELPMPKKILLGTLALATVLAPIIFGAVSGTAAAQNDRDVIPLVRINPDYPADMLAAKREGQVILQFTITTTGTTRDIAAVGSSTPEFVPAAVAALAKWRYQPQMENGQPVERVGVRTMISFRLDPQSPPPDAPDTGPNTR